MKTRTGCAFRGLCPFWEENPVFLISSTISGPKSSQTAKNNGFWLNYFCMPANCFAQNILTFAVFAGVTGFVFSGIFAAFHAKKQELPAPKGTSSSCYI
ncbi:hypothetical protein LQE88_04710 [Acidaminococcus sp. NSJ-142]|uniref:hypothetical protein n=1 Tax=Acidaminococcus TaxID=904 RepID=UPI000CFA7982|nr:MULTISPECIES: hypothetical protein [Acidaminococcus]MCD2435290.1 hypothetical protein [Acidaminococcus hominis]MCH4096734.1 hypothetical protein [Acidaminococcus provencensis]